jgi:hypothetical protein
MAAVAAQSGFGQDPPGTGAPTKVLLEHFTRVGAAINNHGSHWM